MSDSHSGKPGEDRVNWTTVFVFWLLLAGALIARTMVLAGTSPLFGDTDDAMRMVQVRDLIAGQNWFDTTQYRLNPPVGSSIHWSRLVDGPIALIEMAARAFAGPGAEVVAGYVWPLMLLAALLAASAHLCVRLLGKQALLPGIVLPALSATLWIQFAPGRVDHHNVQILLTLLMVSGTMFSWRSPSGALIAGLAAAVSMAIGTETLPFVTMCIATFGLLWVFAPDHRGATQRFGLALGLATVVVMVATVAPSQWMRPACDALSEVYATAAVGSGAVLVLVPQVLPRARHWPLRLAGMAAGGALAVGLVVALFPGCLGGPYAALDPWLRDNWLARVTEAKTLAQSLHDARAYTIGIALPPVLALIAVVVRLWRDPRERPQWLILCAFLGFAILVMLIQVRGARLAAILAVPPAAWVIVGARARYLASRSVTAVLGLVFSWLAFAGFAVAMAVNVIYPEPQNAILEAEDSGAVTKQQCLLSESFAPLRALPPTLLMAPSDLGAHILLETDNSVVGAPYHRNQSGLTDTFRFYGASEIGAREILARRGIELVVICLGLPEMTGVGDIAPDSIAAGVRGGRLPDWLEEVGDPTQPIRLFKLAPPAPGLFG